MIDQSADTILLVEDNPSDAKLTLRALAKGNISNQVVHVKDGQAALDYLFCEGAFAGRNPLDPPRVVMLDIKLPKVDGLEVLRRIRDDARTAQLPVVLLTSSSLDRDIIRGYQLHANSYIVKPVDFIQFAAAVKNVGLYWLLVNTPPLIAPELDFATTEARPA